MAKQRGLGLILAGYLVLSLVYSFASPPFEPPDEATHFRYVKHLLDGKGLPVLIDGPDRDEVWGLHQPPLHFLLAAVLASPFDLTAPDTLLDRNPHVNLGFAQRPGNKNFFLHVDTDRPAYRSTLVVVRLLRFFSSLWGVITLIFVYLIGLELFWERPRLALVAPALMTVHPQFVFINAEIANEPLNIALMTAGLWGCVRLIGRGPSLRLALFLGAAAGAIMLTKMTGLALILLIVVAMLIAALRGHSAIKLWQLGVVIGLLAVLIGGWWYVRNYLTYGDPWQRNMYRDFYGEVQRTITWRQWSGAILNSEVSFWATFGWFNILVPEWIYSFYKILVRVGLAGLIILVLKWLWRRTRGEGDPSRQPDMGVVILLVASPLISSLVMTRLIATESGIQGRQLLPMLPALVLLLVIGYRQWVPQRWFVPLAVVIGSFMLALTVWMPLQVIAPAYARPELLAAQELPPEVTPLRRVYDDSIALLGYRQQTDPLQPGDLVQITFYWQALKPVEQDYTTFVQAIGRRGEKIGEYNGYAGRGNFPPSAWPVGPVIEDTAAFYIDASAEAPTLVQIHVGFFDADRLDQPPLAIMDSQGNSVSSQVTQQILIDTEAAESDVAAADGLCRPLNIAFADQISLECYAHEDHDTLIFYWDSHGQPQGDYTVFIQLWQNGQQVAGFDGPPFDGDFPSSTWRENWPLPGDRHRLDLSGVPPGTYQVLIGLYDPQTGERLPAMDAAGQPLPDYAVVLDELTVP